MSLEKALFNWCNRNIAATNFPHHNLNQMDKSNIKLSNGTNPKYTHEDLKECELLYQDATGASSYYSGYDVYKLPDGNFRVVSCDSYDDRPEYGPIRFSDKKNIKEVVMFLAFKEFARTARHSSCAQMLIHKQIKSVLPMERGYCKEEIFTNYDCNYEPKYDPRLIMELLELDESKCVVKNGYIVPDLTKCSNSDIKLIASLSSKTQCDYDRAT